MQQRAHPGFRASASLFTQMFALALVSSAVALVLQLLLQLFVPLGALPTRTASEIAQAVQADSDWLTGHSVPTAELPAENPAARAVARRVAWLLHLPPQDVVMELSPLQENRTVLVHGAARVPELAAVGDFRLWIVQPGGGYRLYEPSRPGFFGDRLRRNAALLLISAIVMLPITWLVARWLARPFTEFAHAAERLGRDPGSAPPAITGPMEAGRASAALQQMQQRLDSFVTDRTRMLAAIAHDLRTPLTRLAFRIESVDPPLADAMVRDVEEMQQMLSETMRFARADAQPGRRELLDLSTVAAEVAEELSLTRDGISFHPSPMPLPVAADRIALRRLLANLAENAITYGGNVTIRTLHGPGETGLIDVEDSGPGIPEEDLERLFEPFRRLEESRSRGTGGIGLGLPIARSAARAHGGDVVLMNRPEGGVRARVTLPLEGLGIPGG